MTKGREALLRRLHCLFQAREGEVAEKELCLNFNEEEIENLFLQQIIKPSDHKTWVLAANAVT